MDKVIIYGIGNNYFEYESWLRTKFEIIGYVDRNPSKVGSMLGGLVIHNPDSLLSLNYDYVIVTPNVYPSIIEYLVEIGVDRDKIRILHNLLLEASKVTKLEVGFYLAGGMGDNIIAINYIFCWMQKYCSESCNVSIVFQRGSTFFLHFGEWDRYFKEIYECEDMRSAAAKYDLFIMIRRYPEVIRRDDYAIASAAPNIIDYIVSLERFRILHYDVFKPGIEADRISYLFEISRNRTRFMQCDFDGSVLTDDVFCYPVEVDDTLIEKFGIERKNYITIHRGCDKKFYLKSSVKLWREEYYDELICLLKKEYPDKKIVLLGEQYEYSEIIRNEDINLLGRTNQKELMAVLRNSILHIDTEGGLVHLRHSICGGQSVVLFGPTEPKFFGYSENLNIRTDFCKEPCEWKTVDWAVNCCNSEDKNICMNSISPQLVICKIREKLSVI